MFFRSLLTAVALGAATSAVADTWYEVDWAPFKKHAELYQKYEPLRTKKSPTLAEMKVKMDMDQYEALNGEKPKTYEEFMDVIIKKGKADGIQLPMLPYYQEYGYDPDTKELVVIEYPEKKKAMEDQSDRELGRK